jgi:aminomethyltransferase
MSEELRKTPLYDEHKRLNGRMVPFGGWDMPVQYAGILEESRAVRNAVGLFDISHMGRVLVSGEGALAFLQRLTSNDVAALGPGQAQYSLLTNEGGGVIDDIIVYRQADDRFLVVINASNTAKDLSWFADNAGENVRIDDATAATAMIAVQGPEAPALVDSLTSKNLSTLGRFEHAEGEIGGAKATFWRTGYSGEVGFEVIVPKETAPALWRSLVEAGGVPCGLGARDALRIEAGYPLYGHEIDDSTTPVEAGLMWVVKLAKGAFTGSEQIAAVKENGPDRRLVGVTLQERIVPRQGYTLFRGDEAVGTVTSGVFSPTRSIGLGMAYVHEPHHKSGTTLEVDIRGKRYAVLVVPKKNLLDADN